MPRSWLTCCDILPFHCVILLCLRFFFNDTATTEIYTLSLHDALPILRSKNVRRFGSPVSESLAARSLTFKDSRSEEHTSELQSRVDLVCRLLLEKKKRRAGSCSRDSTSGSRPPG